jgi:hypothetical protein
MLGVVAGHAWAPRPRNVFPAVKPKFRAPLMKNAA